MSVRNLEALLRPASVVLVGASEREGSMGCVVLRNLRAGGFKGPIWTVNDTHETIASALAWHDVASLPAAPDLAVICTPALAVPGIIAELGAKGTRAAIVLSAGSQAPALPGEPTLEQAMRDAARPYLLRILGPNCMGALVPGVGLNASFAPGNAIPGKLAFVTQSSALAAAMLDWANARGIGFSHCISLGDSADVDVSDLLDYLASDGETRAILLYLESLGAARKFMSAARAAARNKPVIVVKAGRTADGAIAAASHASARAGSDRVFSAAIRRAGMLRVDTLEALFDAAETLAWARPIQGRRLAIVTNGGGAGVLACDALSRDGGQLASLSETTRAALDRCLPPNRSHGDPVDIASDAPVSRYQDALRILLAAPEVDALLFIHAPTAIVPADAIAIGCLPLLQQAAKPALACWLGGAAVAAARSRCGAGALPCYETPERAVAAWMQLVAYADNQRSLQEVPYMPSDDLPADRERAMRVFDQAIAQGREWLDASQVETLLAAYRIPTLPSRLAHDVEEAVTLATRLGFPVVLKIVSPQIVHKSDVGGVALGLSSEDDVRRAVAAMRDNMARLMPGAELQGFQVQSMALRTQARQWIAGIDSDPVFGPVVRFGEGGAAVEQRRGPALGLPPLSTSLASELIGRSQCAPLLAAERSRPAINEAALVSTLVQVSRMACDLPALAELDINPLLVHADGVLALDARVRVRIPVVGEPERLAIRPYPQALEERVQVAGRALWLRPIRPEDGQRLMDFYANASPHDMRLRFFFARREVPRSELARYSQIDYDREMAFVALTCPPLGDPVMAGDVHAMCDPDNRRAEFALQVAAPWQGQGLGRLLLAKMIRYLHARGTAEIVGECLRENGAMAAVARGAGFEMATSHGVVTMRMALG